MRGVALLLLLVAGCGASSRSPAAAPEGEPCSGRRLTSEEEARLRDRIPVRACKGARFPELVGLWGVETRPWPKPHDQHPRYSARFTYDGCYVTFNCSCDMGNSLLRMQYHVAYGPPPHRNMAHRMRAVWEGDVLYGDSLIAGATLAVRKADPDGTAGMLDFRGQRVGEPLVRITPRGCVDAGVWDLLHPPAAVRARPLR